MATAALIPVSEYLATSYHPDCDYIHGELKERNVGETLHGSAQLFLGAFFLFHENAWGVLPTTEQRIQVSADRFRVADLCVRRLSGGADPIVRTPPLLCIEVMSPGDSLIGVHDVVDDYLAMGVEHVWIVDPVRRRAWTADVDGFHPQTEAFAIVNTPIHVPLSDLWARLDRVAQLGR